MLLQKTKVTNMSVLVTVDSAEEVESTFKMKEIRKILNEVEGDEEVAFEILCNGNNMSEGVSRKVSYRVTGNSNEKKRFLEGIKKIEKPQLLIIRINSSQ